MAIYYYINLFIMNVFIEISHYQVLGEVPLSDSKTQNFEIYL